MSDLQHASDLVDPSAYGAEIRFHTEESRETDEAKRDRVAKLLMDATQERGGCVCHLYENNSIRWTCPIHGIQERGAGAVDVEAIRRWHKHLVGATSENVGLLLAEVESLQQQVAELTKQRDANADWANDLSAHIVRLRERVAVLEGVVEPAKAMMLTEIAMPHKPWAARLWQALAALDQHATNSNG